MRRNKRRRSFTGVVVAMAVALLAVTVVSSSASAEANSVMLRGQIKTERGGNAEDIEVIATLRMPPHLREGAPEEVVVPVVGSFTTGKNGAFAFAMDPEDVPSPYRHENGAIALNLLLGDGENYIGSYNLMLEPPTHPNGPWHADVMADTRGQKVSHSLALKFTINSDGIASIEDDFRGMPDHVEPVSPNDRGDDSEERTENIPPNCINVSSTYIDKFNTIVQILGTRSNYVRYDYEYAIDRSSDDSLQVGIGASLTGNKGTFDRTGKIKLSNTNKIELSYGEEGITNGDKKRTAYYTKTHYRKYKVSCGTYHYYEMRPTAIDGSAWKYTLGSKTYSHCSTLGPGTKVTRTSGSTIWLTNGVKASAFGANLELKNDLMNGSSHKVTFRNTARYSNKKVCGQHADIGSSSRTGTIVGDY